MVAFTDMQTGCHHYLQQMQLFPSDITITDKQVAYKGIASVTKKKDHMQVDLSHKDFSLHMKSWYGKGAIWQCDDGKLQMGLPGEREITFYYSYTNMPTSGELTYDGKTIPVKGKLWFDKQGGTCSILKRETNWEWFSLRFYDDEEMMLFTFPQSNYQDRTYMPADGKIIRLTDYEIKTTRYIEKIGMKSSSGWSLHVYGKKKECYTIVLVVEGNINFAYFGELCWVKNAEETAVGVCFAELLGGVLNEKSKQGISNLFKALV